MIDYDPHLWRDHLLDVRGSVLKKVGPRVLLMGLWAALVGWVDHAFVPLAVEPTAHAFVGVALGLLLVFRTNASYDRFWEGRRQWGAIVNASRNLSRGATALMVGVPELSDRVRDWASAFAYALMHRLRDGADLGPRADHLPALDTRTAYESGNLPLACAAHVTLAIGDARRLGALTPQEQLAMDAQVSALVDAAGACDRIHRTPLPFAYVVHLRRALMLYCGSLPFASLRGFGWGEIVVTVLVSFILLGIEEIGVEIEDPFGVDDNDLPLETFCATIDRDLHAKLTPPRAG